MDPTQSHFVNFVEFTETRGGSKFITGGGQNSSATPGECPGPPDGRIFSTAMAGRRRRRRAREPRRRRRMRRGDVIHVVRRRETVGIPQERDAWRRDGHSQGVTPPTQASSGRRRDRRHAFVVIQDRNHASSLRLHAHARRDVPFVRFFVVVPPRRQADEPSSAAGTAWTAVFVRSFYGLLEREGVTSHVRRTHITSSSRRDSSDEKRR